MARARRISPQTPIARTATRLLKPHLEAAALLAAVPARAAAADTAQIHDLRVSCRRAQAALLLFEPFLRRRNIKEFRRALRDLRRAAGPLRDNSVLLRLARVRAAARPEFRPAARYLTTVLTVRRHRHSDLLAKHTGRAASRRLRALAATLLDSLKKADPDATIGDAAATALAGAADEVRDAARADLHDLENLHLFRRRLKSVRFLAELLGPVLGTGKAKSLHTISMDLSSTLGAVNDLHQFVTLLERETPSAPRGTDAHSLAALLTRSRADLAGLVSGARSLASGPALRRILDQITDAR